MKKIISLVTITAILIASCTKNVNDPQNNNSNSSISNVVSRAFVVTNFTDNSSGVSQASIFSGYIFTFNAHSTISAVKNGVTEEGSYLQKPSHEGEASKLTIAFVNAPLSELNKQWQIDLLSNNAIHLSDDGNAKEVLQFEAK